MRKNRGKPKPSDGDFQNPKDDSTSDLFQASPNKPPTVNLMMAKSPPATKPVRLHNFSSNEIQCIEPAQVEKSHRQPLRESVECPRVVNPFRQTSEMNPGIDARGPGKRTDRDTGPMMNTKPVVISGGSKVTAGNSPVSYQIPITKKASTPTSAKPGHESRPNLTYGGGEKGPLETIREVYTDKKPTPGFESTSVPHRKLNSYAERTQSGHKARSGNTTPPLTPTMTPTKAQPRQFSFAQPQSNNTSLRGLKKDLDKNTFYPTDNSKTPKVNPPIERKDSNLRHSQTFPESKQGFQSKSTSNINTPTPSQKLIPNPKIDPKKTDPRKSNLNLRRALTQNLSEPDEDEKSEQGAMNRSGLFSKSIPMHEEQTKKILNNTISEKNTKRDQKLNLPIKPSVIKANLRESKRLLDDVNQMFKSGLKKVGEFDKYLH
jgi:hypothetical protein